MKRIFISVVLTALMTACETPNVFATADRRQQTPTSRIEGHVVLSTTARGRVILFLYDANRLPPPQGSGRPVSFSVLAPEHVFQGAADTSSGPFTAPFSFSQVMPGQYVITGMVDTTNAFVPWYTVTNEPQRSDVGGAAVDPQTGAMKIIGVSITSDSAGPLSDRISVSFSDTKRVAFDRPAFEVESGISFLAIATSTRSIDLKTRPISDSAVIVAAPTFLAQLIDDNGDGLPDDANGDSYPDAWPKVVVRKLTNAENSVSDENDIDRNGILDLENFADYDHFVPSTSATIAADGKPDAVILAAAVDLTEYMSQLVDDAGHVKTEPLAVTRLKLVISPRAIDISVSGQPEILKSLPSGRYSITLIQSTGQSWRIPNELDPTIAPALGFPSIASQSFYVQVP